MKYYPITPDEIGRGAARLLLPEDQHRTCIIPVRQPHEYAPGQFHPMMGFGSLHAYTVLAHNGKLYGVYIHDDEREFLD